MGLEASAGFAHVRLRCDEMRWLWGKRNITSHADAERPRSSLIIAQSLSLGRAGLGAGVDSEDADPSTAFTSPSGNAESIWLHLIASAA